MQEWKQNDLKGIRRSKKNKINLLALYIKEILKANDKVLQVSEKSRLEKARDYEDSYPCLSLRKTLKKIRLYTLKTHL